MRFMLSFRVPTEKANATIKDGTFPQTLQSIMEELKPEAATSSSTWTTPPNSPPWQNPFSSEWEQR
jgi:hypothetical protein